MKANVFHWLFRAIHIALLCVICYQLRGIEAKTKNHTLELTLNAPTPSRNTRASDSFLPPAVPNGKVVKP
jgi:hypothetical protein